MVLPSENNLEIKLSKIDKPLKDFIVIDNIKKIDKSKHKSFIVKKENFFLVLEKFYTFNKYRKGKFYEINLNFQEDIDLEKIEKVIYSYFFICNMINEPSNVMNNENFHKSIEKLLNYLNLENVILKKIDIDEEGPITKSLDHNSYYLELSRECQQYDYAIVGKGVMFDTGGYSLKRSSYMVGMEKDMAGGAIAVFSFIKNLILNPEKKIICLVPVITNYLTNSLKPSDIIKSYGNTIRIGNTDAEGRLILYEGVGYVLKHKFKKLIVIGTLTGTSGYFFGPDIKVAFTNCTREGLEDFEILTKSDCVKNIVQDPLKIADLVNVTDECCDSYHAALFSKYLWKGPWTHFDIAGSIDKKIFRDLKVMTYISNSL